MDDDRYNLDSGQGQVSLPPRGGKRPPSNTQTSARAAKVWFVYSLPRYLGMLALIWLLVLFHVVWPEAAEFRAKVHASQGMVRMLVPGTFAPEADDRWTECWPDRMLLANDTFLTGADGQLDLEFAEGTYVRLNRDTRVGLAQLHFDRGAGGRQRVLMLPVGSLFVRSATTCGTDSRFAIQAGGCTVSGANCFYYVNSGQVTVTGGTVSVKRGGRTVAVEPGKMMSFSTGKVSPGDSGVMSLLKQADGNVPTQSKPDRIRMWLVNKEERVVLQHSGFLLGIIGHKPGDGNPLAKFSILNSTRRAQALKRMDDVHTAMTGVTAPPSLRLDAFGSLGVDHETIPLVKQAFFRSQFMSYRRSADGRDFELVAFATDRAHTKVVLDSNSAKIVRE
ncbi:MAG: FecR domain-containing protein [Armatimonadetes bacterium]|nr:FecR domain-containing protein [Armatimonadota bacterium]